jgi:hypothetical protein
VGSFSSYNFYLLSFYNGPQKIKNKNVKVDEEKRAFNSKWEEVYFCAEQGGKPPCLI